MFRHFFFILLSAAICLPISAQSPDYLTQIKPILDAHCIKCHGPQKQESSLRLDSRSQALRGGDSYGPAIKPGHSADSPLIQFVSREDAELKMPPTGKRLSSTEIDLLRRWINDGASWPASASSEDAWSSHWSFQPLQRPILPAPRLDPWCNNAIDRFVATKLDAQGLQPSPAADRRTLIRRLYFDLLGLPPTPEEIAVFELDTEPNAYERLVEQLLASPQYGQRWARHWLDVVRFAESHGFEMNQPRPNAWRYRDYVIDALNQDKPYDKFVCEQIVGDALNNPDATSFLVAGPWDQVKSPDVGLTAQQRADELHDMVATTGSAFLALTIGCARCHSHKFDPISHTEYHAVKACLEGVQHGERETNQVSSAELSARGIEAERLRALLADLESAPRPTPVNARLNVERFAPVATKKIRMTIRATSNLEPCLDEFEVWTVGPASRNVALTRAGAVAKASSELSNSPIHRLEYVNDGLYGNSRSWISKETGQGWIEIEFAQVESIDRVLWGRDRTQKYTDRLATDYVIEISGGTGWRAVASAQDHGESAELVKRRQELEQLIGQFGSPAVAYSGRFAQPGPTMRFHRGDPSQPREAVAPGTLAFFGYRFELPPDAPEQERRFALATWITDRRNPLTARVIANRLWQFHFGQGIVSTPSDFGINGSRPSHPELLDWLASELLESPADSSLAWNMKRIHRLICCSATYQQSSSSNAHAIVIDANGQWFWRYPPQRLEAEPLRDSMLAVSGTLNLQMGGPGFDLFEPNTNYVKVYTSKREFGPGEFRRMVYQAKPRMQLEDTFGAFDCPDAGQIAPRRSSSTTPLQALNLLNSPFSVQQAEYFAKRLERECRSDLPQQIERAFQLAFGRPPSSEEQTSASDLVANHGLPALCRALFNANEFIYVR